MTAALEGVSGHQHAPSALYLRERASNHFTGGWVGSRASLAGRKSLPHRDFLSTTFIDLSVNKYNGYM